MSGILRFTGRGVSVIAPKEAGAGKIEVQVDGQTARQPTCPPPASASPNRRCVKSPALQPAKHVISIINRGSPTLAVDALDRRGPARSRMPGT